MPVPPEEEMSKVKEYIEEHWEDPVVIFENPDYEDAFIGISHDGRAVYDFEKMILCLCDCMDEIEAIEFIEYNTIRALPYYENSPIILYPMEEV